MNETGLSRKREAYKGKIGGGGANKSSLKSSDEPCDSENECLLLSRRLKEGDS